MPSVYGERLVGVAAQERRARAAEGMVREAGRLSLKGEYASALERLAAAEKLDPQHAEIEGLRQAASAVLESGTPTTQPTF